MMTQQVEHRHSRRHMSRQQGDFLQLHLSRNRLASVFLRDAIEFSMISLSFAVPPTSYRGLLGPSGPSVSGSVPGAPECPNSVPRVFPERETSMPDDSGETLGRLSVDSLDTPEPRSTLSDTPVFGDALGDTRTRRA